MTIRINRGSFERRAGGDQGFTLIEMMITLVMTGIIMAAVYSAYIIQQKSYYTQDQVVEMQQNVRAAFDIMSREIRMAGYAPPLSNAADSPPGFGIVTATAGTFKFKTDFNGNGSLDAGETITYALNELDSKLTRDIGGGAQPVADNIDKIEFYYTMADGAQTLDPALIGSLNDIRAVKISVLAQAADTDTKFTNSGNYTRGSGNLWVINGDERHRRRRLLVATVQCRNMGL